MTYAKVKSFIRVRTELEGWHHYPDASKIDHRIGFLEHDHRHLFKISVKISVSHNDRELEFFLVKWALQEYLSDGNFNNKSCEMICQDILNDFLIYEYGEHREYEVIVSEDGESDGILEYYPINQK